MENAGRSQLVGQSFYSADASVAELFKEFVKALLQRKTEWTSIFGLIFIVLGQYVRGKKIKGILRASIEGVEESGVGAIKALIATKAKDFKLSDFMLKYVKKITEPPNGKLEKAKTSETST